MLPDMGNLNDTPTQGGAQPEEGPSSFAVSEGGMSETTSTETGDIENGKRDFRNYEGDEVQRQLTSGFPSFKLEFVDLNRDVKIKKGTCKSGSKRILFNLNARFESAEMTALMGPSGAGKSSALSELSSGTNSGLLLNGKPTPKKFSEMVATIPQADILFPALTPQESLRYSARLRLPQGTSKATIERVIDGLIEDLHLGKCKDTPVGDEQRRGVSGGERKRVSIGTELVVNPAILLVDEPSSGLDSTAAEFVIELLRKMCKTNGQLMIITIHQPSYNLFKKFDKLLLLHHGRVVYHGQCEEPLHNYFKNLGFVCPEYENPLDYYFRELQHHEDQEFFNKQWENLDETEKEALLDSNAFKDDGMSKETLAKLTAHNTFFHQYVTLLRRFMEDTVRDKEKFFQALAMKCTIGILLGVLFVNQARKDTNASIFTRFSPLFFLVISAVFDTAFNNILTIPLTRPLIVREYKNGAYSPIALFLALASSSIIFDGLSSLGYALAIPIVGLFDSARKFFLFLAVDLLITCFGSALGIWLGSTSRDIKEAQSRMLPIVFPLLLFGGFLLPKPSIPDYFIWLYYLSPFQWALTSLLIVEFVGLTFVDGPYSTGTEYLESQNIDPDNLGFNIGMLAIICIAVYVGGYFSVSSSMKRLAKV